MIGLVLMSLVVVDLMLGARLMVRTRERVPRVPTAWEMLLWRSFPVTRRLGLLLPALLVRFPPRGFLRTFLAREACVCGVYLYPTFFWIFSGDFLLRKRLFWAETYPSGSADGDGEVSQTPSRSSLEAQVAELGVHGRARSLVASLRDLGTA